MKINNIAIFIFLFCFSCVSDISNRVIYIKSKKLLLVKKDGFYLNQVTYFDINKNIRYFKFIDSQKIKSLVLDSINNEDLIDIITFENSTIRSEYQIFFDSIGKNRDTLYCKEIR